jgi:hypothetical protein
MRYLIVFLLSIFSIHAQDLGQAQHCGYDFTSYLVLDVHDEGKKQNIKGLKLSLVDLNGNELINVNNKYSWKNENRPLIFAFNYKIDEEVKSKISAENKKERWFFPYAKDNYFLSVINSFPADEVKVKIEDIDGTENGGLYETQIVDLGFFDLFVLCTNQAQEYIVQFGRKANKPLEVILKKVAY